MIEPVKRFPIVPLIDGGSMRIQTIHIDDLCEGITNALEQHIRGAISLADPAGITMKEFLREVALHLGKKTLFVPLPSALLLPIVRGFERINVQLPISSENILGLRHARFVDTRHDLARIRLSPLTSRQSLERIFASSPPA